MGRFAQNSIVLSHFSALLHDERNTRSHACIRLGELVLAHTHSHTHNSASARISLEKNYPSRNKPTNRNESSFHGSRFIIGGIKLGSHRVNKSINRPAPPLPYLFIRFVHRPPTRCFCTLFDLSKRKRTPRAFTRVFNQLKWSPFSF